MLAELRDGMLEIFCTYHSHLVFLTLIISDSLNNDNLVLNDDGLPPSCLLVFGLLKDA